MQMILVDFMYKKFKHLSLNSFCANCDTPFQCMKYKKQPRSHDTSHDPMIQHFFILNMCITVEDFSFDNFLRKL